MKLYRITVNMADNEYGSDKMLPIAKEIAMEHGSVLLKSKRAGGEGYRMKLPLLVMVQEHGGWWMQYYFDEKHDGLCVGSANDSAKYSDEVIRLHEQFRSADTEIISLGDIRRVNKKQIDIPDEYHPTDFCDTIPNQI